MSFYFLNESMRGGKHYLPVLSESSDLPVRVEKDTWQHMDEPRRIAKIFSFTDPNQQIYFVTEVMKSIKVTGHKAKILVDGDSVQIETRTEDIDDITELDLELARNADEIFNDAMYVLVSW